MSDLSPAPTPTNEQQDARLARIFWDAWLAAQDQSRANQAGAGINAVLAAVSAAAPDERAMAGVVLRNAANAMGDWLASSDVMAGEITDHGIDVVLRWLRDRAYDAAIASPTLAEHDRQVAEIIAAAIEAYKDTSAAKVAREWGWERVHGGNMHPGAALAARPALGDSNGGTDDGTRTKPDGPLMPPETLVERLEADGRLWRLAFEEGATRPAPVVSGECDHARAAREIARTTPLSLDAATALIDSLARGALTLADAWDEGWRACAGAAGSASPHHNGPANPYRTVADAPAAEPEPPGYEACPEAIEIDGSTSRCGKPRGHEGAHDDHKGAAWTIRPAADDEGGQGR